MLPFAVGTAASRCYTVCRRSGDRRAGRSERALHGVAAVRSSAMGGPGSADGRALRTRIRRREESGCCHSPVRDCH